MADTRTITSANAAISIVFRGLFPVPVEVKGFSVDRAFTTQTVTPTERPMGIDGKMSVGYVPYVTPLEIMLQADSDSIPTFDDAIAYQKATKEAIICDVVIIIPGSKEKCIYTYGAMASVSVAPDGGKTLQPRMFGFEFQDFSKSPI